MATALVLSLVAYLFGSVPIGVLVAKGFGTVDPRTTGSGNIGATNVGRSSGKLAATITLAGDLAKGALPTAAALTLAPGFIAVSFVGFSALLGHIFPVFLGFKGGKGVATATGVMLVIAPFATLSSVALFIVLITITRRVSIGSIGGVACLPLFVWFFSGTTFVPLAICVAIITIAKHTENIKRLVAGNENKF